jgi:hypothetical protein
MGAAAGGLHAGAIERLGPVVVAPAVLARVGLRTCFRQVL